MTSDSKDRTGWGGAGEDYRLKKIGMFREGNAPQVEAPTPDNVAPMWSVPPAVRALPWFEIVMIGLGLIGVAFLAWTYVQINGVQTALLMTVLAMLPLLFVIAVMARIDRWEPEPVWSKIVAFVWGAGVATLTASIINTALMTDFALATGNYVAAEVATAVVVAPIAEEIFKGLGVAILIAARRTSINSLLDGVVYAGFAGAGFAFVENIQYFLNASAMGTSVLTVTVFMRGVLSPFVHPMATSLTGAALAWAVIRSRRLLSRVVVVALGWAGAIFVHALWNFLASTGDVFSWVQMYVVLEIPLFFVWIATLLKAASRESQSIAQGLVPYVRTGWVLPAEIPMVTDRGRRKAARLWARTGGRESAKAMDAFLTELASLGLDQHIQAHLGPIPERMAEDRRLLQSACDHRQRFLHLTSVAAASSVELSTGSGRRIAG
ncbi:PrsW family intramembrane metalloprotease [Schaalia vaccimaxillae]|uniref:PrsW family intramembrane metalloprotease n=1 Tax=Schaalia vaccimaxillae TaxID=183916 RepID=UPI0003B4334A|nr:PrsW family intramembrane metalloprotease [Schaalia vaccimaxillae]